MKAIEGTILLDPDTDPDEIFTREKSEAREAERLREVEFRAQEQERLKQLHADIFQESEGGARQGGGEDNGPRWGRPGGPGWRSGGIV